MRESVLVLSYGRSHFREMIRVGRLLARSPEYRPVMAFAHPYPGADEDGAACDREGIDRVAFAAPGPPGLATSPLALPGLLARYRRRVRLARDLIAAHRPCLIVLPVDSPGAGTAEFVRAGRDLNVPSLIVPFSIANHEEALHAYGPDFNRGMGVWTNRLMAPFLRRWVRRYEGRPVVREPAVMALALELSGMAPPVPWMQNSSHADRIAVESAFMREYYRRGGIREERMALTGALYNDDLAVIHREAEARRAALYAELGLPPGRPMLLVSLPPPIQTPERDGEFFFHEEFLEVLVGAAVQAAGWNVVLCLHPMLPAAAADPFARMGVRVAVRDTAALVPLCQLYVACLSATIRWALACGIPAVNYDPYGYRYSDYREAVGVFHVHTAREYRAAMEALTGSGGLLERTRREQAALCDQWGVLDGGAGNRLMALIRRMAVPYGGPIRTDPFSREMRPGSVRA